MANSTKSELKGYQTSAVSSVAALLQCTTILVYNKNLIPGLSPITVYNIDEIYDRVKSSSGTWVILDQVNIGTEDPKKYKYDNWSILNSLGKPAGFNNIIYLDSSQRPRGYTSIYNEQGVENSLTLSISLSVASSGLNLTINLSNSLSLVSGSNQLGDKRNEYSSGSKAVSRINDILKRGYWTNSLRDSGSQIYLNGVGSVISSNDYISLGLSQGKKIDVFGYCESRGYQIKSRSFGYLNGSLAIYTYYNTSLESYITVSGISSYGRFGDPIVYYNLYVYELPAPVIYGAGNYVVLGDSLSSGNRILFDLSWDGGQVALSEPERFSCIDPYDKLGRVRYNPSEDSNYSTLLRYFPELADTSISIEPGFSYQVIRKIGAWFIISKASFGDITWEITSPYLTISVEKGEDLDKFMFINDRCVLKIESDEELWLYDNSVTPEVISRDSEFLKSPLVRYRRGVLPKNLDKIPNIIGTFGGFIFYLDDNNTLNYL